MADDRSNEKTTARKLASANFLKTVGKVYNEQGGPEAFQSYQAAADQDVQDALAEDLHLDESEVVMVDEDSQDDGDKDNDNMEVEEVVPLKVRGRWKCPLCTKPRLYEDKRPVVKHIASGEHN